MSVSQWQQMKLQTQLEGHRTYLCNNQILDAFETEHGFRLPDSYRSFCEVFGPGLLCNYYWIGCPWPGCEGEPKTFRTCYDLMSLHKELVSRCRDVDDEIEEDNGNEVESVRRARFFARDHASYYYFWDPEEISQPLANEYGIYMLTRHLELKRVAETFADFVTEVCVADSQEVFGQSPISLEFQFATPY